MDEIEDEMRLHVVVSVLHDNIDNIALKVLIFQLLSVVLLFYQIQSKSLEMDTPYQAVHPTVKKWNCNTTFLLSINIFYLLASLALIIWGVLSYIYIYLSASFLLHFGFSYNQYAYYLYIYGAILLPTSCVGIAVVFRQSIRFTKCYVRFLSTVTILEIVFVIATMALSPFLKDAIWNIIQETIDQCDITSIAHDAINHVQMVFACCGLNRPDMVVGNETRIQTSCYSKEKYTVYNSYCYPENHYEINCFDRVYSDVKETASTILIVAIILIATQCLTIYSAIVLGRNIRRQRNNYDVGFSSSENAVYSKTTTRDS